MKTFIRTEKLMDKVVNFCLDNSEHFRISTQINCTRE